MITVNVYIVYTTRKQQRARFICLVGLRHIVFRRAHNLNLGIDRDGSVCWDTARSERYPLASPLTLFYKGAILLCGGRKLAN